MAWRTDIMSFGSISSELFFSISWIISFEGLSDGSSIAFLLQYCLICCLSISLSSGSEWLCSNRPPNTINSSKSVLHQLLHPLSMHLHAFEFLKTLSFLNLKPSIIIPGFPRLVVNFSMANHQVNVSEGFANLTCIWEVVSVSILTILTIWEVVKTVHIVPIHVSIVTKDYLNRLNCRSNE